VLLLGVGRLAGVESVAVDHERKVHTIVERLLDQQSWKAWASIGPHLLALAEASPETFLKALEGQLVGEDGQRFARIFSEGDAFFSPTSPHVYLLWALEILAWSPRYLRRTGVLLVRLAKIDPGGKTSNRPLNSLREIFLAWNPSTYASSSLRLVVLDAILQVDQEIGWRLLKRLLPKHYDTADGNQKPTWRDFGEAKKEIVTVKIANNFRREIVSRFLDRLANDPERWAVLFEELSLAFHRDDRARIPQLLAAFDSGQASSEARTAVWARIRDFIAHQRSFADAEWSLPEQEISALEEAARPLVPADPVARTVWLFDSHHPKATVRPGDEQDEETGLQAERACALRDVHAQFGVDGLIRLACSAKLPGLVMWMVPKAFSEVHMAEALLDRTRSGDESSRFLASVVSSSAEHEFGAEWRELIQRRAVSEAWPADMIGYSLSAWPDTSETWDFAALFGDEARRAYWRKKRPYPLDRQPVEQRIRAVKEYLDAGCALAGIDAVSGGDCWCPHCIDC
jgi:hypothetical protein